MKPVYALLVFGGFLFNLAALGWEWFRRFWLFSFALSLTILVALSFFLNFYQTTKPVQKPTNQNLVVIPNNNRKKVRSKLRSITPQSQAVVELINKLD